MAFLAYIQGEDRNQIILFPESIDEYIDEDNVVRVIDEYVDQLDVVTIGFKYNISPSVGRPPYNPKDMLKLYIYGYLNRIRSSRRLEHETIRNIEVMWLLKKMHPDFKTIADFRKNNKKALKSVFREFNKLCDEWGLFGKEIVAIDGSKFRASNSKKNNFSNKKLDKHIEYIDKKISNYMTDLEEHDRLENNDRKLTTEEVKKRIDDLRTRKELYEGYKEELTKSEENELSITDPDARMMSSNNNGMDVSYNVQTTVDDKHKLIVDFKVTSKANDLGELDNMALRTKKLFGGKNFKVLADKGYYKAEDLKRIVGKGITPYVSKQVYSNGTGDKDFYSNKFTYDKERNVYVCPAGNELHYAIDRKTKAKGIVGSEYRNYEACSNCELKERCTRSEKGRSIFRHVDQDFLDTIDNQTHENIEIFKERQKIVEHPFGTIKRSWGGYYFLTRKKASVTAEIGISFLAYNMKRVINILGSKEILKRLRERRKSALV